MSWQQLLDILHEQSDEIERQKHEDPVACPNDGEPLQTGPDGRLFCRFDGWRPTASDPGIT